MSYMRESNGGTFEAAVAAAALAAISSENGAFMKHKQSTKEQSMKKPTDTGSSKFVRWLSNKDSREDTKPSGETSSTINGQNLNEKAMEKAPSFKKTPTFSEESKKKAGSKKTVSFSKEGLERAGNRKTQSFSEDNRDRRGSKRFDQEIQPAPRWDQLNPKSTILGPQLGETKVDAWEREQLQKIRERFDKMNSTILEWENEKKMKAKRKLERKEREIETRRLRAQARYREEMERIDKIAGDARVLAEDKKRNDEIKAIEKAKKMRSAERSPKSSCPCF